MTKNVKDSRKTQNAKARRYVRAWFAIPSGKTFAAQLGALQMPLNAAPYIYRLSWGKTFTAQRCAIYHSSRVFRFLS
jgi:hypothetical protein